LQLFLKPRKWFSKKFYKDNLFHILKVKFLDKKERKKTLRKKYERRYRTIKKNLAQLIISLIFLLGIILGSLYFNTIDSSLDSGIAEISLLLDNYIDTITQDQVANSYLLGSTFINYAKQIIFVWVFGLTSITIPLIMLIVGIQGFSYGFTSSFFMMKYNAKGLILCLVAYGIQGSFYIYIMYSLSMAAIRFTKKDVRVKPKIYFSYFLASLIGVCIISLYETYIMPVVIQYVIERFF